MQIAMVNSKLINMLVQFSSVAQSCPTLCDPTNCSTPGLPVYHQLPEATQTHVHWVGDASNHLILCHPLFLLPSIFPSIRVFSNESALLIRWPKYWSFSFSIQWTLRTDLLQDGLVRSPCSPRDSQESSPTPQSKSINSLALSFLYSPALTLWLLLLKNQVLLRCWNNLMFLIVSMSQELFPHLFGILL